MKITHTHKAVIRLDLLDPEEVNAVIRFLLPYAGRIITPSAVKPVEHVNHLVKIIKEVRHLSQKDTGLKVTKQWVEQLIESDRPQQVKLVEKWVKTYDAPIDLLERLERALITKQWTY